MYDNVVREGVHGQEGRIDKVLVFMRNYIDANTKDWMISAKDFLKNALMNYVLPWITSFIFSRGASSSGAAAAAVKKLEPSATEKK